MAWLRTASKDVEPNTPDAVYAGEQLMNRCAMRDEEKDSANPKLDPTANVEKEPDDWVSGDDPMTPAQASYLKTLCEQAGDPEAFDAAITKAEASRRIDALREDLGLDDQGRRK